MLTIAVICFVIFMGIASYLWYLYFHDYEGKLVDENCRADFSRAVTLTNTGNINYYDAATDDSDSIVPVYYFSVKNTSDKDYNYTIVIENTDGNDGCTPDTRLTRAELEYELKLDNKVIKRAGLDTISNNILDSNVIKANSTNDYSLKIRLKNGDTDYENKHFHYVINIQGQE
jgi:hypothetical protein